MILRSFDLMSVMEQNGPVCSDWDQLGLKERTRKLVPGGEGRHARAGRENVITRLCLAHLPVRRGASFLTVWEEVTVKLRSCG